MNIESPNPVLMYALLEEVHLEFFDLINTAVKAYYAYTYKHAIQTAIYTDALADVLKLSPSERSAAIKAAFLHDIGKIGITDQLIAKPGALTEAEYEIVKHHSVIGAWIVERIDGMQALVPLVRHHHERWDGHGYPDSLKAQEIPWGARILALADALDAMLSPRPYRRALAFEQAQLEIVCCSGSQFDPQVVDAFLEVVARKGENLSGEQTP